MFGIIAYRIVIGFLAEFLNLTGKTDLDGIVFVYLLKNRLKYRVFCGGKKRRIGEIYAKLLCREKSVIVIEVREGLRVGSTVCIVPHSVNEHFR